MTDTREPLDLENSDLDLRGSSQIEVRAHNERLILSLLRSGGPAARAQIARRTGLSAQTISVIIRGLENDGLIERCEPVRGKVGQPLVPMRLARDGAFFFGVKVGRRSSEIVLIDFLGEIIGRSHKTYEYPTPEDTVRFIRDSIDRLTEELPPSNRDRVAGLGIGIPGYLWEWAAEISAPADEMAAWRDRDIGQTIAKLVDYPVYVRNEMSCACGAELVFGRQSTKPHFLYFYVGLFIGGGVVLNNTLFTGPTGNAGALGPLPVPTEAGGLQQLVSVASLSELEAAVKAAGGNPAELWESPSSWSIDPGVLDRWIHQVAGGLSYAIAASCSLIDFQLVVIDGWLPKDVRTSLVQRTAERLTEINLSGLVVPELREGTMGADARPVGAACIPLSKRFLVNRNALATQNEV